MPKMDRHIDWERSLVEYILVTICFTHIDNLLSYKCPGLFIVVVSPYTENISFGSVMFAMNITLL
jgi:hypothetical protein